MAAAEPDLKKRHLRADSGSNVGDLARTKLQCRNGPGTASSQLLSIERGGLECARSLRCCYSAWLWAQ